MQTTAYKPAIGAFRAVFNQEILPELQKPSRYLGTELHSVHKDPATVDLRVALVFPDLYDLGLGNLGIHILYAILNRLPWCWAERAYAPSPDLEEALRRGGYPLFALESKDSLTAMDLIGFSLQSELTYTSVLNVMDLAGIPLRACDRNDTHPVVFAGGPAAVNPEPMAPFFDFIVIGDGEDVAVEIGERLRDARRLTRADRIARVADLPGVYVPERYPVERSPEGVLTPKAGLPPVQRRVVSNLDTAAYPVDYLVPFTQLVHDRIGLEIMRGCTHGCRFCQAGIIGRPVRERSVDAIEPLLDQLLINTGYEEVSLVSLSTCDYPRVRTLLRQSAERVQRDNVSLSVPSLRLDTFSVELVDAISGVRRSGLTFAPEAATPRLRRVINKYYEDEELLAVVEEAFRRGWEHVKLYFMIGLPTETDEDVVAIADLCLRVLERGRSVTKRAKVFTGISTFVPKPFTPFQWVEQISLEETRRRQAILEQAFARKPGIKYGRHEPESTFIEGLLARADRQAADLIESAYRRGARLDSSSELLNFDAWLGAVEETGFDVAKAFGARSTESPLPWDQVEVRTPKMWLLEEYRRAMTEVVTPDCREGGCRLCGVRETLAEACRHMLAVADDEADRAVELRSLGEHHEPEPVQRLRFRVGRHDEARFLSHLEFMTAWLRALQRASAPLSFSQGFHAHPKVTFATALPVGEESEGEWMDIVLKQYVDPDALLRKLQTTLPLGLEAYDVREVPLHTPSLMSVVTGYDYVIMPAEDDCPMDLAERVANIMTGDAVAVSRKGRPEGRRKVRKVMDIDIRPMIHRLEVTMVGERPAIVFETRMVNGKLAKSKEIIALLGLRVASTRVVKQATLLA